MKVYQTEVCTSETPAIYPMREFKIQKVSKTTTDARSHKYCMIDCTSVSNNREVLWIGKGK